MSEEIERDIRIAVWNTCRWQGMPQEMAQSFIRHLFDGEPCMKRATAALEASGIVQVGEALAEIASAQWPDVDASTGVDRIKAFARQALASLEGAG